MRTKAELTDQLATIRSAPADSGTLALLVARPGPGEREVLAEGLLDPVEGLKGDNWLARATSAAIADGRHLDAQLNVMSARMVRLLSDDPAEQAMAGDQIYVDLDISVANLPAGTRLTIGRDAVIEVTAKPHNGCRKFLDRFGQDVVDFVNSPVGKDLRLRGFNARVDTGGIVRPGDTVRRLAT